MSGQTKEFTMLRSSPVTPFKTSRLIAVLMAACVGLTACGLPPRAERERRYYIKEACTAEAGPEPYLSARQTGMAFGLVGTLVGGSIQADQPEFQIWKAKLDQCVATRIAGGAPR